MIKGNHNHIHTKTQECNKTQAVKTETFSDSTLDYDSMFEYPARVKRCCVPSTISGMSCSVRKH